MLEQLKMGAVTQPIRVFVEFPLGTSAVSPRSLETLADLSDSLSADPRVSLVRSVAAPEEGIPLEVLAMLYSNVDSARVKMPGFLDAYLSLSLIHI